MSRRLPLTAIEKEQIYQGKLQGKTLAQVARKVGCSLYCARKWWRRGRDEGRTGLLAKQRGRRATGILSHFEARVKERALTYKQTHPGWGAKRVLVELKRDRRLKGLALPHPSRLTALFKQDCPECVATPKKPSRPRSVRPPLATGVHEIWQLDCQEGIRLKDGEVATICNIRDPVGAAIIASRAFAVKTKRHWRKLTLPEVRQVLRTAFAEWRVLPDAVLTDNELGLAGNPTDHFPSLLTLWLVGLGVSHFFIRPACPTDQPQVERCHRTLDNFALNDTALLNLTNLQDSLDRERYQHNHLFPSQASDCAGRPPLTAHPELLRPRRPYRPEHKLSLFDWQRAADYLAIFTFERKVSTSGQVSLGGHLYSVGRPLAGLSLLVRFDAQAWQWVMLTIQADEQGQITQAEVARRSPKGFDIETLTGLQPETHQSASPLQLTFPCFIAA